MPPSPLRGVLAVALALVATPAAAAAAPPERERPEARVVVSDGRVPRLSVFDLDDGRRAGAVRLPASDPAHLAPVGDRRHVAAIQHEGGRVSVLDGGSWAQRHGDHAHVHVRAPALTPFRFAHEKPSHVVSHGGTVSVFTDGDGTARQFRVADLRRASRPRGEIATGTPHHGVAVPLGEHVLVSAPDPAKRAGELPVDVSVRDRAGSEVGRLGACPELHGEASGDGWAAFACADGVLVARLEDGRVTAGKLAYPERASDEERAWGLQRDRSGRYLVGDLGERALLVADRATGVGRALALPAALASFAVVGDDVHVLTEDGHAHRLDLPSGRRLARARVTRRFDAASRRPTPELAAGAGRLVVSEPARGRVHVLRAATLRRTTTIATGGTPRHLEVVGVAAR
jgi:hypothetical protein